MRQQLHRRFNTSHVVVYLAGEILYFADYARFNTSHVVVYHLLAPQVDFIVNSFNTSHVVVYRLHGKGKTGMVSVSIHLML